MYRRKGGTKLFLSFVFDIVFTFPTLDNAGQLNSPFPDRLRTFLPLSLYLGSYNMMNTMITFFCLGNANLKSSNFISLMPSPALLDINKHCCLLLPQLVPTSGMALIPLDA